VAITATEPGVASTQLWYLSYPLGEARRITKRSEQLRPDQRVGRRQRASPTVQGDAVSHLWIASGAESIDGLADLDWDEPSRHEPGVDAGRQARFYVSNANNNLDVWICGRRRPQRPSN
jgi:hypothetical protein